MCVHTCASDMFLQLVENMTQAATLMFRHHMLWVECMRAKAALSLYKIAFHDTEERN